MDDHPPEITSIKLSRGPCFGTCPIYQVTLSADGTATWDGESFVDRLGHHTGQTNPSEYQKLSRFIQRAGFFDWAPEHIANVTDTPDYVLSVVADGETRTVRQNGVDRPADFWAIAALVDHLADRVVWTTSAQNVNCHDWTAVHQTKPAVLTVRGVCTFPTAGFAVELRRRTPQGINARDLLLDRVVHPPTGPVAQVETDVETEFIEETDFDFQSVTILPDGPSITVRSDRPAPANRRQSASR